MSLSSGSIKLIKGVRQREKCDPEGEPTKINPKRGRRNVPDLFLWLW